MILIKEELNLVSGVEIGPRVPSNSVHAPICFCVFPVFFLSYLLTRITAAIQVTYSSCILIQALSGAQAIQTFHHDELR